MSGRLAQSLLPSGIDNGDACSYTGIIEDEASGVSKA